MAFSPLNYDIDEKMPEWWRNDPFLEVTNKYAMEIIRDTLGLLLPQLSPEQPWQVWKTLPEEYNWEHTYQDYEDLLGTRADSKYCTGTLGLGTNKIIVAKMPNTKRPCDAIIDIDVGPIIQNSEYNKSSYNTIKELVLVNKNQKLIISDINTNTKIRINTKDQTVAINGVTNTQKINGGIKKIYATPREKSDDLKLLDENKKTELILYTTHGEPCELQLSVKLLHPVYVTEQNIKIHSVSMFPIKSVQLYGYFCHEFNNKNGWVYLFNKTYAKEENIVHDRITKQFDCEIFYIKIQYYGIALPITIGFPQEELAANSVFQTNAFLDYWGEIFSLPRRYYKQDIKIEEERDTYPRYYRYNIEQDYWYERRILNEYKINDDKVNSLLIQDTDGNNMAMVNCIDPYIENLYIYTESILPQDIIKQSVENIYPTYIITEHKDENQEWDNPNNMKTANDSFALSILDNYNEESIKDNSYKADLLHLYFEIPELPENALVNGMSLKMKGVVDQHSEDLFIDERSYAEINKKHTFASGNIAWDKIKVPISAGDERWPLSEHAYTLGGKNSIFTSFALESLSKEELLKGCQFNETEIRPYLHIALGFSNANDVIITTMKIFNLGLNLYYQLIEHDLAIEHQISSRQITKQDTEVLKLKFTNNSDIKIQNKKAFIVVPSELNIKNEDKEIDITLNPKETLVKIINIRPNGDTGKFNFLVIYDDQIISEEVIVL